MVTATETRSTLVDVVLDPVVPLKKDVRAAAKLLSHDEARFLVDRYYIAQDDRKRSASQVRSLTESGESNDAIQWLYVQDRRIENQIKAFLQVYADFQPISAWAQTITGIGPVLSAGLTAHIDITRSPSCSALWAFAGLDPSKVWGKGEKRPWNAGLKVLAWKLGESFVKVSNHDEDFYGHFYAARKLEEIEKNERFAFKAQAAKILQEKRIGKETDAYKAYSDGKLPPAHIHARAKRLAVKLFLANYWEVAYYCHYGYRSPKRPYVIDILGHQSYIEPPNLDAVPGMRTAKEA